MQLKYKIKHISRAVAIALSAILLCFGMGGLTKPSQVYALADGVDFIIAKTNVRQASAQMDEGGRYLYAYESSYNQTWQKNDKGDYVYNTVDANDDNYYFIKDFSLCNYAGNAGNTHVKVIVGTKTHIIPLSNNRYTKAYNHGYNYTLFPDFVKNSSDGNYILYDNQYYKLVYYSDINVYEDENLENPANNWLNAKYIKINGSPYAISVDADRYSFQNGRFIIDNTAGTYIYFDITGNGVGEYYEIVLGNHVNVLNEYSQPAQGASRIDCWNNTEYVSHPSGDILIETNESNPLYTMRYSEKPSEEWILNENGNYIKDNQTYYEIIEGAQGNCYIFEGGNYQRVNDFASCEYLRVDFNGTIKELRVYPATQTRYNKVSNSYYYDIFRGESIVDGVPTSIAPFSFNKYNYKIKSADYKSVYLPTYFTSNQLSDLYFRSQEETDILIDGEYYQPLFNEVIVNTADQSLPIPNTPFITLDNYQAKTNLENNLATQASVENLYISFGDVYLHGRNEFNRQITNLNVSATLQNKYTNTTAGLPLVLNPVTIQQPVLLPDGEIRNEFWYQYLDVTNLQYYVTGDTAGKTAPVLYPEGLYSFSFTGQYRQGNNYQNFVYNYSFYLSSTEHAYQFPSINEVLNYEGDTLDSVNEEKLSNLQFPTYYYNFQTLETPIFTFDASKYNATITKTINQSVSTITTQFKTLRRNYDSVVPLPNVSANEMGLLTYYLNDVPYEHVRISAEAREFNYQNADDKDIILQLASTQKTGLGDIIESEEDNLKAFVYTYTHRKANINETNYLDNLFGEFYQKFTTVVFVNTFDNQTVTTALHYSSMDASSEGEYHFFDKGDIVKKERIIETQSISDSTNANTKTFTLNTNYQYYTTMQTDAEFNEIADIGFTSSSIHEFSFKTTRVATTTLIVDSTTTYTSTNITQQTNFKNYQDIENNYNNIKNSKTEFTFNVDFVLEELGVYNIQNKFNLSTTYNNAVNNNDVNAITNYVINPTTNVYNVKKDYTYQEEGEIKAYLYQKNGYTVHIFGVKSYFNKNGKTEFKNSADNIYSNITHEVMKKGESFNENSARITLNHINGRYYPIANVPVTNMPPVSFDYFCTYAFDTGYVTPQSKLYRYNFAYDENGKPYVLGSAKSFYFNKDDYPSADGYYEIIVKYYYTSYNTLVEDSKYFYQVFAFVIDNSSPSIQFEHFANAQDEYGHNYNDWITLHRAGYTNNDVRITWNQTTFFQYEVHPTIQKDNFNGIATGVNGSAQYYGLAAPSSSYTSIDLTYQYNGTTKSILDSRGASITYKKFANSHVYEVPELTLNIYTDSNKSEPAIKTFSKLYPSSFENVRLIDEIESYNSYYYEFTIEKYIMQMIIPTTNVNGPAGYWGSGNYSIRLNYGSDGSSYLTQSFSIDTLDITGMKIAPVDVNAITKVISAKTFQYERLVAEPFTFMYERKASGASITTTYTAIPFTSTTDIDLINLNNNLNGISASHYVNGFSLSANINNSYSYDYSFYNTGDAVYLSNIFSPSSSMLYIFNLTDSAGNQSQFYVVYDTTNPNFFINIEDENNYLKNYNTITELTDVAWGNYKAIEVAGEVDNQFVFGDKQDKNASKLNHLLKDIYIQSNTNNYAYTRIMPVWLLTNGKLVQAEFYTSTTDENNKGSFVYYTDGSVAYADEGLTQPISKQGDNLVVKYYVLMPINNVNFQYFNTNSNQTDIKTFNYSLASPQSTITKNSTILAPTKASLANKVGVSITDIENDTNHIYGFYGENKYIYTISDIMGNESGSTLWMNLDSSLAFAYGNFINTNSTLSRYMPIANLELLTPFNSYSSSQLYFSYLMEDQSPETKVDYKYYDFDFDFYSNYTVTNLAYSDETFTLTFTDINNSNKNKVITINRKSLNNINADGEDVLEPLSMFPFSLIASADTASWKDIEPNNYINTADPHRIYSNIINPGNETNESGTEIYTKTKPGLYVFRRTYTDYVNSTNGHVLSSISDLENQTAYKYYVYMVDRNGIINLTDLYGDALNLDNLNMLLGAGIDSNNYSTEISEQAIYNKAISNLANTNASYSSMTVNNLLLTNKMIVQLNLSMDKYNQPLFYHNFLQNNQDIFTKQNIVSLMQSIPPELYATTGDLGQTDNDAVDYFYNLLHNFMFGISDEIASQATFDASKYYNNQFLIRLDLNFGNTYSIIGNKQGVHNTVNPNNDNSNQFLLSAINNRTQKTTATHRSQLADGILLNINNRNFTDYNYIVKITDSAGITEGSNIELWNRFANSISFNFGINASYPSASFFGKYNNSVYQSNTATNYEEYANRLFNNDITTNRLENTLEDLNRIINDRGSFIELYDTNNKSLIFVFDKTQDQYLAEINPYNISITRTLPNGTTSNIFNVTQDTNGNLVYNTSNSPNSSARMANAFVNNVSSIDSDPLATSWAIVIFDANSSLNESMRLSDYDLNATYNVTINYKGLPTDYVDIDNAQYYSTNYSVTVDKTKPLFNIIQLMEKDNYILKPTYNYTGGHQNINSYYNEVLAHSTSELFIQNELERIYDYYANFYLITDENGDNVKFDDITDASLIHNHFFAVDSNFTFRKLQTDISLSNFDTADRIYFRRIDVDDISNYKFSLTRDDYDYATNNHPLFTSESAEQASSPNINDGAYYYVDFINPMNPYFTPDSLNLMQGGYYEIIERDEAGNYRVYAIYYSEETPYNYSYTKAIGSNSDQATTGVLDSTNNTVDIYGNNLTLTCNALTTKDLFLSASIDYSYTINSSNVSSGSPIRIELDAVAKQINIDLNGNAIQLTNLTIDLADVTIAEYTQIFLDAVTSVYTAITDNNENINDFVISITFYNRVGENYIINYYVPGQEIKYIRTGNEVAIPQDSEYIATRIMKFEVYQYRDGIWQIATLDYNRKSIVNGNGTFSLGGHKYVFRNGAFRFVLTDNFGRTSTYYESFDTAGTVSQRLEYSGTTKIQNNLTYTGKPVVVTYNSAKYMPVIYAKIENDDWMLILDIENQYIGLTEGKQAFTINKRDITENNTTTSTLHISVEHGYHVEYKVIILNIEDLSKTFSDEYFNENKDMIEHYEYDFVIYTKLPTLQLRDLNGVVIAHTNGQSYMKDIIAVWNERYIDGKTFDFNARIELKRVDENNVVHTQTIPNSYQITLDGSYTLTLTNDLGYVYDSITFIKVEAETAFLYKIYSRQVSNGEQVELTESNYSYMSTELDEVIPNTAIYNYYALSNFNNYIASTNSPNLSRDHIFIVANTNHSISAKLIKLPNLEDENTFAMYEIYDGNKFVIRYVKVNFIARSTGDFSSVSLISNKKSNNENYHTPINIVSHIVKSSHDEVILNFNITDESNNVMAYNQVIGNEIFITRWYNGVEVESIPISKLPLNLQTLDGYSLILQDSGYHKITITDLAGNQSMFMGVPYLNIYIVNSIIYQVNDDVPVNNQVFNEPVNLEVITRLESTMLYDNNDYSIVVNRNGSEYNPINYTGINHRYTFSQSGYYEVVFRAYVSITGGLREEITNTYNFRIVNPKTTVSTFGISSANNFRIISLSKKIDISEEASFVQLPLKSTNQLWISAEDPSMGEGYYQVTVEAYVNSIKQARQFTFDVWISATFPTITANVPFGTETTNVIVLSYNPHTIFQTMGEGRIVINGVTVHTINEESENTIVNYNITQRNEYWIQILTDDGNILASYKLIKNDPLNTNAKIAIVISSITAVSLTVIFIMLRRRRRFK